MKTLETLAKIIARQTPENDPKEIIISYHMESMDDETATVVRFACGRHTDIPAVIYDDDTCFTPYDWELVGENWDEIEWYNHELQERGIILNGLPRLF